MPDHRDFEVRPSNAGVTLAAGLRKMLGESYSWADIKRLIASRKVHLNGNLCVDEARPLARGDRVRIFEHSRAPLGEIRIVHLDRDLVILEKPPGLNTLRHREESDWPQRRKDLAPTVEELAQRAVNHALRTALPHGKKPPPSSTPPKIRPVHRLDRDTSGLMLFALTPAAEQSLESAFAAHAVRRLYHAVIRGHLPAPRTLESHLVRDRGDGLRGSIPPNRPIPAAAQRALTRVRPLRVLSHPSGPCTLVECGLETGRTHQIRIHLAEAGHPLCGEKTYTHPLGQPPSPDPTHCPRQALHSATLALTHPATGQSLSFTSPLPPDLAAWMRRAFPA